MAPPNKDPDFVPATPTPATPSAPAAPDFVPATPGDFVPSGGQGQPTAAETPYQTLQRTSGENQAFNQGLVTGAAKEAMRKAANFLDFTRRPAVSAALGTLIPGVSASASFPEQSARAANWLRQHAQINSPGEKEGAIAESVLELMALPEVKAEGVAQTLPSVAEHFGTGQKLAKMLAENPKALTVMRIGLNTLRGGGEMGAQTYLATGSPTEALHAAKVGAATGGALTAVGEPVAAGIESLAQRAKAQAVLPSGRMIEDVAFPTTRPTATEPIQRAVIRPGGLRPATEQVEQALENSAQRTTRASMERANQLRPPESPLPAGLAPARDPRDAMVVTPSGPITIPEARMQLHRDYRAIGDPDISNRAKATIQSRIDANEQAVQSYDQWIARQPNFPLQDTNAVVPTVTNHVQAGEAMMDQARPFFIKAKQITGGDFLKAADDYRSIAKDPYATDEAIQRAKDNLDSLFNQYADHLSPTEHAIANQQYREGIAHVKLGTAIENQFKGYSAAEVARDPTLAPARLFEPGKSFNNRIEKIYQEYKPEFDRTIGVQGITDVKRLGTLFQDPQTQEQTANLLTSMTAAYRRHGRGILAAAGTYGAGETLAAHYAGHAIASGMSGVGMAGLSAGVAAGTITGVRQYLIDRISTDPEFARAFIYAAENRIPPRVAGPALVYKLAREGPLTGARAAGIYAQQQPQQQAPPAQATATAHEETTQDIPPSAPYVPETPAATGPPLSSAAVDEMLTRNSQGHTVDLDLLRAMAMQESGGKQNRVSAKGAIGIMQLMPKTAEQLGVDAKDPEQNVAGGIRYMEQLLDKYHGDRRLALAAYNAGPDAVDRYGDVPPYAETQNYVDSILADYARRKKVAAGGTHAGNE